MVKRLVCAALCLVLLFGIFPAGALAAQPEQSYNCFITPATSAVEGVDPSGGTSVNSQNYSTWATTVKTALAAENGGYTLVTGSNGQLKIEFFDSSFCLIDRKSIDLPLPLFGGVYICSDYNFVVCAQNNLEQDNSKEVYRVIRYSKNWDNPVYCSLYGGNTTTALRAGSLRFARWGDNLYVRTCHEMYRSSDGSCHQACLTMLVNVSSMSMADSLYGVSNTGRGYVSHSFNQFIHVDGGTVIAADHGDAYPRSLVISKYKTQWVSEKAFSLNAFPIADNLGHYNGTGVSLGGFDFSDTHYLLAGNSCDQSGGIYQDYAQRNIFVAAVPKASFSYTEHTSYITDYTEGDGITVTTPHLVKMGANSFCLLWSVKNEADKIYYCTLDGAGRLTSDIRTAKGNLSDCPPICVDGEILWVTNIITPHLHRLSPEHSYRLTETAPACGVPGSKLYECTHCDKSFSEAIPALEHSYEVSIDRPDCTEEGTAFYSCTLCGHSYSETAAPGEHEYTFKEELLPGCDTEGSRTDVCTVCGHEETAVLPPAGHKLNETQREADCSHGGGLFLICENCDYEEGDEIIPPLGHDNMIFNRTYGNCRQTDSVTYRCRRCGELTTEEGGFGDHGWDLVDYELPDCENGGFSFYECRYCDEEKREESEATGHDYYVYCGVPAFCNQPGSETKVCFDCGHRITVETPKLPHEFVNNSCLWCGQLAAYSETVSINYRRIKIVLNGEEIIPCDGAGTTVEPFIMSSNGTTYLPLRAVAQALGLNVNWDGEANTVSLSSGGTVKTGRGPAGTSMGLRWTGITYRQIKVFLNGEELDLINRDGNKVEPFILNSNSSVYLPLRIIGEALGLYVSWDGDTSTVYLDSID